MRTTFLLLTSILLSASAMCAAGQSLPLPAYHESASAGITLLDEGFDGSVSGSMDNVIYSGNIDDVTVTSGWSTSAIGLCAGNFVFAPALYPVTLTTPSIPVSTASPLRLSLTMAEYNNERYYTGAEVTISLLAADGSVAGTEQVTLTRAGYERYDIDFDAPLLSSAVRLMISYDNAGSNRKLFLDRLTVVQSADASVEGVECTPRRVWISGPGEITVGGSHARVYTVDGRCIYDGSSATLSVGSAIVIVDVDGATVKLRL